MNKVKEINVYENYELEDSKFRIKVNSIVTGKQIGRAHV